MTLTEFLTARLDEEEAEARAAAPGPWHTNAECDEVLAVDDITVAEGFALSGPQTRATTRHIARHDPARVLAEVEAKRAIVGLLVASEHTLHHDVVDEATHMAALQGVSVARIACQVLAHTLAEHPDYDEAWRLA